MARIFTFNGWLLQKKLLRGRRLPIKPIVIRPMVKVSHHVSLFNPLRLWQPFDDAVGFHADADDAGEQF